MPVEALPYWIIKQLRSNVLAIGHVLINIALIAILPGVALGMTTMTLVSESLGNDQVQLAHQWPTHVHGIGKCMIGFFSLIVIGAPSLILRPFVSDPILLSLAVPLLRIDALTVFFEMGAIIYMHALTGATKPRLLHRSTRFNGAFIYHWRIGQGAFKPGYDGYLDNDPHVSTPSVGHIQTSVEAPVSSLCSASFTAAIGP